MVLDATDESTLEKINEWMDEVYKHANKDVIFVLAGNKCDVKSILPTTIATAQARQRSSVRSCSTRPPRAARASKNSSSI